ncbi:MAG: PAS domain S-box protein [Nitrospirae bacterium]|nr:PAS domain S-box protein [Nitrospirota bacterium]
MFTAFRDLPIRLKLMRINMLVSASVLLLASMGFIVYELVTFRNGMVRSLSTQAEIVGINTVSAVLFNDPASATETLTALRVKPNILSAAIYTAEGRLFARYVRSDGVTVFQIPEQITEETVGDRFQDGHLFVLRPIVSDGKRIGRVAIQSDLREMEDRLKRYAAIVAGVLAISLLAAYGVSSRLQGRISGPILHLAQMARTVSEEKNYSIRATVESRDEVGRLVETFNEMLAQIQVREEALQKAHDQLEQRVEERTRELHQEIAERKQAEEKFRAVAENANDAIVTADRDGHIIYFNKGAERTFGYSVSDAVGRPLTLLMPERFHDAHRQGFKRFLSNGEARVVGKTVELVGRGKNGTEFPVELSLASWKAGGETFFTGILRDITERKQAEEEKGKRKSWRPSAIPCRMIFALPCAISTASARSYWRITPGSWMRRAVAICSGCGKAASRWRS